MFFKHITVGSLAAAFLALGGGSISAQNTMTGGTVSSGASQNSSGVGTSQSGQARPATIGEGDRGRITKANPKKRGKTGADGSPPKPNVKDDPKYRCLAPSGVC